MATKMPVGGKYFGTVRRAREALLERAHEIIEAQMRIVKAALDGGDFETAAKANQFLIEHLPSDEDGVRAIDISVDKPKQIEGGPKGPVINIGLKIGGVNEPRKIAPSVEGAVIDVE